MGKLPKKCLLWQGKWGVWLWFYGLESNFHRKLSLSCNFSVSNDTLNWFELCTLICGNVLWGNYVMNQFKKEDFSNGPDGWASHMAIKRFSGMSLNICISKCEKEQ